MPRMLPLWRWEPLPYVLSLLLAASIGALRGLSLWGSIVVGALVATLGWIVATHIRGRRVTNPDRYGVVHSTTGLRLVPVSPGPVPSVGSRPVSTVAGTQKRQTPIVLAGLANATSALLVPRCRDPLGLRLRVGVHLVGGASDERVVMVGHLDAAAEARWADALDAEYRATGGLMRVPAQIVGERQPYRVELDLGGLAAAVDSREMPATG